MRMKCLATFVCLLVCFGCREQGDKTSETKEVSSTRNVLQEYVETPLDKAHHAASVAEQRNKELEEAASDDK